MINNERDPIRPISRISALITKHANIAAVDNAGVEPEIYTQLIHAAAEAESQIHFRTKQAQIMISSSQVCRCTSDAVRLLLKLDTTAHKSADAAKALASALRGLCEAELETMPLPTVRSLQGMIDALQTHATTLETARHTNKEMILKPVLKEAKAEFLLDQPIAANSR